MLALASLALSFTTVKLAPLSTVHYGLYLLDLLLFLRLTWLNHHTSRTSSTTILVFWPIYALISAVRIRTMIISGDFSKNLTHSTAGRLVLARESLWLASGAFGLVGFLLELYSPEKRWKKIRWSAPWSKEGKLRLDDSDDSDEEYDRVDDLNGNGTLVGKNEDGEVESPVVTANFYERLTFSWLTPMLQLGTRKFLGEEDMWTLPAEDSAEALSDRLQATWNKQLKYVEDGQKKRPSLKIALWQAYGGPYAVAGVLKGVYDCLNFLQPQLLRLLLSYVSSYGTDHPMPPVAGFAISILMFLSSIVATAALHQYFDRCFATSKSWRDMWVGLTPQL